MEQNQSARRVGVMQVFDGESRSFGIVARDLPERLREGEVLVRISLATICGSDLHTIEGRREAPDWCVLGHEAVGVVVKSRRDDVVKGDRVTWSLADQCGCCEACVDWDLPQKCGSLFKYGHAALDDGTGWNGCYASHILLRGGTAVFQVPEVLADEVAAPANCALATIVNALSELPGSCRSALIQGAGLLGLYACAWLKEAGVERVYCVDVDPGRLEMAERFGAVGLRGGEGDWEATVARIRREDPRGVDLVVEVAGVSSLVAKGMGIAREGGSYVWVGMVHPDTVLELAGETVVKKCLRIRGVHNYRPGDLEAGLAFLSRTWRKYPYGELVSAPFILSRLEEAVELARTRRWLRVSVKP